MKAWFGLSGQPLLWLVIVTTALVLFLLVRRFERYMVFHPSVYPAGFWRADAFGIAPEDCTFRTSDELTLHGWFIRNDQAIATFLWCHGNAGNLSDRLDNLARLAQLPFNIFIFDYRGYGKSEGTPSEEGLYLDAEAAYHFLLDEKAISPDKLILFGRSLGGAVAIDLATKHAVAGVIVESTFTTISDMARHLFPYLPTVVLKTKFESQSKVSRINAPILILHGSDDKTVPALLGRDLFEAASDPKEFHEIAGAGHNDTYVVGGDRYFQRLLRFATDHCQ